MSWNEQPYAPAPGTMLCRLEDVPDGACKELVFGAGKDAFRMLLLRREASIWGYVNNCPHYSIPLNAKPDKFVISGYNQIMCAIHCSVFRFEDGHCIDGPAQGTGLEEVPVEIEDDAILVKDI